MNSGIDTLTFNLVYLQSFDCFDDSYAPIKGNYGQRNYAGSLFKIANQDINVSHQNKLLNMSTSA